MGSNNYIKMHVFNSIEVGKINNLNSVIRRGGAVF